MNIQKVTHHYSFPFTFSGSHQPDFYISYSERAQNHSATFPRTYVPCISCLRSPPISLIKESRDIVPWLWVVTVIMGRWIRDARCIGSQVVTMVELWQWSEPPLRVGGCHIWSMLTVFAFITLSLFRLLYQQQWQEFRLFHISRGSFPETHHFAIYIYFTKLEREIIQIPVDILIVYGV